MIIYIRHGNDDGSDPTFAHDPRITEDGRKKARKTAFELVKDYGSPKIIFCSPFKRTIQTAKIMKKMCGANTEIYIDPNLSRYFCTREKCDPQLYPETERYDTPIYESWNGFERRVNKHLDMIEKNKFKLRSAIIWCITHALVYKHIARTYQVEIPNYIPFMHSFFINANSNPLPVELRRKSANRRLIRKKHRRCSSRKKH